MNRGYTKRSPGFDLDELWSTLGELWTTFKTRWLHRLLYAAGALGVAYLSVQWSADGLGFAVSPEYRWAGVLIAIGAVAIPEYMFVNRHHRGNITLTIACLLGYAYGVISNWLGMWVASGQPVPSANPVLFATRCCLWGPLGIMLEVLPAPMLNAALGIGSGGGFFTELGEALSSLKGLRQTVLPRKPQTPPPPEPADEYYPPQRHSVRRPQLHGLARQNDRPEAGQGQPAAVQYPPVRPMSLGGTIRCPKCGSVNTEFRGGHLHCYSCGNHVRGYYFPHSESRPQSAGRATGRPIDRRHLDAPCPNKPSTPMGGTSLPSDAAGFQEEAIQHVQ